ncbi:MAG: DUF4870 family protein [Gammaproteobacteria bacterium]
MPGELSETNRNTQDAKPQDPLRKWVGIVYLLQILSLAFAGIPLLIGAVINYLKRAEVQGTWLESHFTWQITTFWYIAGLAICGLLTFAMFVGYLLFILSAILLIYRVFRGWSRWNVDEAIEQSFL